MAGKTFALLLFSVDKEGREERGRLLREGGLFKMGKVTVGQSSGEFCP